MPNHLLSGIVVVASLGCSTHVIEPKHRDPPALGATVPQAPLHNEVDSTRRQQLVARAEQALATSHRLDYRLPLTEPSTERRVLASLYFEACRAGDNPSCWIAGMLWDELTALDLVQANCLAGDLLSCRVIPRDFEVVPEVPGWAGRLQGCDLHSPPLPPKGLCSVADLRKECLAGFPFSCRLLYSASLEKLPDRDALVARVRPLAREGCQARIDSECRIVDDYTEAERLQVTARMCPLALGWCSELSTYYRDKGELTRARDFAELACQYGETCLALAEDYVNGVFPEPVPGRGEALLTWACRSAVAREFDDVCKARAAKERAAKQHGSASKAP